MTDLLYIDPRAREFLEAFPVVPEVLRPCAGRFADNGMLWLDPNVDTDGRTWPGALRLTEAGQELFDLVTSQKWNGYDAQTVREVFAMARLSNHSETTFPRTFYGEVDKGKLYGGLYRIFRETPPPGPPGHRIDRTKTFEGRLEAIGRQIDRLCIALETPRG